MPFLQKASNELLETWLLDYAKNVQSKGLKLVDQKVLDLRRESQSKLKDDVTLTTHCSSRENVFKGTFINWYLLSIS